MQFRMRVFLIACALSLWSQGATAQSWAGQTIPTSETLRAVHFLSDTRGWAAGYNGTILHTTDGGNLWSQQNSTTTQRLLAIRFVDDNIGWAGAGRAVLRSMDGGANWVAPSIDGNANIFRNNLFPVSATQAWAPATCGSCVQRWFYRYTVVNDTTLTEQTFDLVGGSSQFLDLFFVDADNGWAVGTSGLIRRISAASSGSPSFAPQTSNTTLQLNGIFMLDANQGWAVGNTGTIRATSNGGANWTTQISNTSANLRDVYFSNAQIGWAVGDGGAVVGTQNGGLTWTPEISNAPTILWSVAAPFSVYAAGGDLAVSANATIIKRGPPDRIFAHGFE